MSGLDNKEVVVFCRECGAQRTVHGPNAQAVKRCEKCQYKRKRLYNSNYVKRKRGERRTARSLKQTHE